MAHRHVTGKRSEFVSSSLSTLQVNGHTSVPRGSVRAEAVSPSGRRIPVDVVQKEDGTYSANFTPTESGVWEVSILHGNQYIQGSPFQVRVYEPEQSVRVYGIDRRTVSGRLANFSIETQDTASGKLSVDVIFEGQSIPAKIDPEDQNHYHVSFVPVGSGIYTIHVYFADAEVTGSPYTMEIIDPNEVAASGDGLQSAEVSRRASFNVTLGRFGTSRDLKVQITSPRNTKVPANVYESRGGVNVEFVPNEVGEHYIEVLYYNKPIAGSPFRCQVFDWSRINVTGLTSSAIVDQVVDFDIDASQAGSGNLEIMVNEGTVNCRVQNLGNRQYRASFTPLDPITHIVRITFNGYAIPGSPWRLDVRNPATVTVAGNGLQLMSVGKVAMFEVHASDPDGEVTVNITSPSRRTTRASVVNLRNGTYRVEYIPMEVGNHLIEVLYDRAVAGGSPFTSKAYNIAAIAVSPVSMGVVGIPVEFSIDVSQAGEGQLEIMVNRGMVPNSVRSVGKGIFTVSFVPRDPRPHIVDILFNSEPIPQGTITIPIMSPGISPGMPQGMPSGRLVSTQADGLQDMTTVNRQSFFQLHTQSGIPESELVVRVTSPSGELVPAKMVLQPDGDYKVEYSSKYTGRHTVEILHNNQAIMGSPFFVEIYDPNKIRVEGTKTGMVGERMEFDIIRHQAGKAELKITISGPRGNSVPYTVNSTAFGEHVIYTPREPGQHLIYITYGGLDVPGCPIRQDILDSALASAYGDGLVKAIEGQEAMFYVDARGQRGDLAVQVDGPNSIAKSIVEPDSGGRHQVFYTPVEVGTYRVTVKWNGREIEGSPFHPKVINPREVQIVGGWESLVDANNRLLLKPNELTTIELDTRAAGPGHLTADLRCSDVSVPVEIIQKDRDRYSLSFNTRAEGTYVLRLMWAGALLPRFPVYGNVSRSSSETVRVTEETSRKSHVTQASSHLEQTANQHQHLINSQLRELVIEDDDKVVLTGTGLQTAKVNEHAEFVIDGTKAGPGSPRVQLTNVRGIVNIDCVPVGTNKYRCVYVPQTAGAYLLYIKWADRDVIGSPFKVTVLPASETARSTSQSSMNRNVGNGQDVVVEQAINETHTSVTASASRAAVTNSSSGIAINAASTSTNGSPASRVTCAGQALKSCILHQESNATINTYHAGPGKLVAQCVGPSKAAQCRLVRRDNDTYILYVRPQETGRHVLTIRYNEENIPGSPFIVKVNAPPDPSKVRVSGPGLQNGVIGHYRGEFTVNTQGAGAGELTVKVRGPKGAFLVEMERQSHKDRVILCRYSPVEPGVYEIDVKWSGVHVPCSPIKVLIASSANELHRETMYRQQGPNAVNNDDYLEGYD